MRLAGLIKRPLALPALSKKVDLAVDKLLVRDNMKSAICPLLSNITAIAATGLVLNLDKAAIVDKTAIGWPALIKLPSALIKRPLRLAGLDQVAILPALDKNGSAWPLMNSLDGTI